eukprot:TRINITY_DN10089_c0_g1_i1.p2 TRINITY_DN10089_c0_g1~~TRINITY_DN10089_c0_g1_i1.p2  ORF type:complete len:103 (+),score=26.91 TRINITY_DN10089_c0_g1_i1:114-422(+)
MILFHTHFFFFKQKTAYEMLRSLVGSEMCIRDRSVYVCTTTVHQQIRVKLYTPINNKSRVISWIHSQAGLYAYFEICEQMQLQQCPHIFAAPIRIGFTMNPK